VRSESLKGHLDLLLLAALRGRPAYGYLLLERLRDMSDGTFALPEGTIYPALHRLERGGLLASRSEIAGGRKRRVYRLTARGEEELAGRRDEWARFAHGVARTLEASG